MTQVLTRPRNRGKPKFLQSGGTVETSEQIIKSSDVKLLEAGREYVVFLKVLPQFSAPILAFNNFGAFEVVESQIFPLAGNQERRGMSEMRFSDELDRMRIRRGGRAK